MVGRRVLSLEWKREGVIDGESGDDGDDELVCERETQLA